MCRNNACYPLFRKNITNDKRNNDDQCKEKQSGYNLECKVSQSEFYKQLNL